MQWWDNLWLNEGFATFIGTMAVDHLFPEWVVWTQFVKDDWAGALSLDGKISTYRLIISQQIRGSRVYLLTPLVLVCVPSRWR